MPQIEKVKRKIGEETNRGNALDETERICHHSLYRKRSIMFARESTKSQWIQKGNTGKSVKIIFFHNIRRTVSFIVKR